jgi:hypothetical protein
MYRMVAWDTYEACVLKETVYSVTVYITDTGKILGVFPDKPSAMRFALD